MAKLYLVKVQVLVVLVGERGAIFLPHPAHGALMFQSTLDSTSLLGDLYLLPLAELVHSAHVSTELKDPVTGEEKPVQTALYPARALRDEEFSYVPWKLRQLQIISESLIDSIIAKIPRNLIEKLAHEQPPTSRREF